MVGTVKDRLASAIGLAPKDRKHDDDVPSISNADLFVEHEPTVHEFFVELAPSAQDVGRYVYNLFPFVHWIGKYNWTWFVGDFIAGTTVGAVVVPQGMAYAQLAQLPVEYGLYSSFMGVLIYWFFATSKDITIGPVAVMSQVTGNVVLKAQDVLPDVPGHVVASALAILTGAIILFFGLARLGWVVEFIPLPAICAFMTGSAINILSGQVPKLMGITGVNTRDPPYRVIIDSLRNLPTTKLDAALGLTALAMLYLIRGVCSQMAKRQPHRAKTYFFISTLRTVFVILLYTAISAAVNVRIKNKPKFGIIKEVPRGFQHAAVPEINTDIIKAFASELPAAVIVMLIEHISISKSFGRINNYVIDPSQELVAIGVTNLLGPFLGAYPATGSFSRTAIKSKAGVRTPFAGVITASVVLLALYALTAVFYYIPNAALAAVIIHAVGDVITPPSVIFQFWRVSPLEVPIFLAGVLVTVFNTIENGIYTTVCMSFVVIIWRLFLSRGRILGLARIRTVKAISNGKTGEEGDAQKEAVAEESDLSLRTGFLPLDHEDGSNPRVVIQSPYPGVFIYRFAEGFNYPNASRYLNHLTETIFRGTRRTDPNTLGKLGDRPWNDTAPRTQKSEEANLRPTLKAVILDFSSVNNIDVTATQALIDVRNQLDRYAAPDTVNWHFANIENRWTKRALAAAGFGIADLGGSDSAAKAAAMEEKAERKSLLYDVEEPLEPAAATGSQLSDKDVPRNPGSARLVAVQGLNRPFFHFDLQEAVEAALLHAERAD
ncbi:sulfate permease family protein [Hirsutella rhossiliensis]|uniref:Sulfate permease family domain-containing protein n=1 Tax=Hirsutella rhossiliensis TaxID=111463 RepID=A0A9P8SM67_9HYPO|nr:sulfate permease family domain-containing protein [Hirsutella rhossiliensis]KAH0967666.1 sulfate permease family domain-containing protein [Hirsutella rhossiliensis]